MPLVTVTAEFGRANETPAQGWMSMAPWVDAVRISPDPELVTRARVHEELDPAGIWTAEVIASDDPDWLITEAMPYLARWEVSGSYGERVVVVPGPGPWSLWELVDVAVPPLVVPVPIPGPVGPPPALVDGTTATLPPGAPATSDVAPTGLPGEYSLSFGIPAGVQGDKGDKGDKGDQGEVSVASTVTGNPGTAAAVVDSDQSINKAALNFTIPRGTVVAVGPTVTGAPGSVAAVADGDPGVDVRLDFTIPRGDVGATGPAIGGILTTKGDLAARDATTAVRLGIGTVGQVLTPDSTAATGLRWGPVPGVGNLLTDNQASGTDTLGDATGFAATAAVLTSSTAFAASGTRSLQLVTSAQTARNVLYGSSTNGTMAVTPGQTYTFHVKALQSAGIALVGAAQIFWWTSAGNVAASNPATIGTALTLTASFQRLTVTGTAPANAAFASFGLIRQSGGEAVMTRYEDEFGWWRGAGGDSWQMPGSTIVNLGYRITHPGSPATLVEVWDGPLAKWQTVYSGA